MGMLDTNAELRQAWEFVEHTGRSLFLTGKAGTGKTTFLKNVVEHSMKRIVVVAPTGVAAINAGGVTIHSFFQLPPTLLIPGVKRAQKFNISKHKQRLISSIDVLVIDEISMVRSDLLDAVDEMLRRIRHNGKPFGGVQLLLIGDLQQLTPVVTPDEEKLLEPYYDTPYFFSSHALAKISYVTIELRHIYRQEDGAFIDILNHIRLGKPTSGDLRKLNERCQPAFVPAQNDGYIRLTTHNWRADNYNRRQLEALRGSAFTASAAIEGTFPETSYPTSRVLELKVGAQVMFVKNDPTGSHRYYNGKIGHVEAITGGNVYVRCDGDDEPIPVEPIQWENTVYRLNSDTNEIETHVEGTFLQLPLRLAWAITIHKSQGLTFDRVIIEADAAFASGQVYVALSRCRSMAGIVLAKPIREEAIINDARVDSYICHQKEETRKSVTSLPHLKDDYHRSLLCELFDFGGVMNAERRLMRMFAEYFANSYPRLTSLHKDAISRLDEDIDTIARKWKGVIKATGMADMRATAFLERIEKACAYFRLKLKDILYEPLKRTRDVKTNNKEARRRLSNAYADACLAYLAKWNVLSLMSESLFSVPAYLRLRQKATVLAIDDRSVDNGDTAGEDLSFIGSDGGKGDDRPAKKASRQTKERTAELTLRMFRSGMEPGQIAQERGLTVRTVYRHLAQYVAAGVLPLETFVDNDKRNAIEKAISTTGTANGRKAIRNLCPPDVTYADIQMVIAAMKAGK